MSVIKNLRNLSSMQFYKNAIKLRKELTNWMIRDFGTTKNKKHIAQVVKDIDIEDVLSFDQYNINRFINQGATLWM